MMKKALLTIVALLFTVSVQAKLNIVTTTSDLASIATSIGGKYVNVTSLQSGKRDPHFLQAKPSYIIKAKNADLWIRIGMELEIGYEPVILEKARNPKIMHGQSGHLDCSEVVLVLDKPTEKIDRSMGDVHGMGNPHYWLDPYNGRQIATIICKRLQQLDSDHQAYYEERKQRFCYQLTEKVFGQELITLFSEETLWQSELDGTFWDLLDEKDVSKKLGGWKALMHPHKNKKVATYHKSWIYFLHRFDIVDAVELEPKPGIPPSPGDLANVIETIKQKEIEVLMMEPYYPRKHGQTVHRKTGIPMLVIANATGGEKGTTDYMSMLENIVMKLHMAFSESGK